MNQSDNHLHLSEQCNSVLLPCACGNTEEHLVLSYWPESDPFILEVNLPDPRGFWARLRWIAGGEGRSWASMVINLQSATALHAWLGEKIAATHERLSAEQGQ